MLGHLRYSHGLSWCLECETRVSETPIEELWSHITSSPHHAWDQCIFCETLYLEKGLLHNHLTGIHEIRTCSFCPSETSFDMRHVFDKHKMSRCPECGTHVPEERVQPHLRFTHNWVVCTICGASEPDEDALEDHEENHPACDICRQKQMKLEDLRKRLEPEHGLVFCPFCSFRTTDLLQHVQEERSLLTKSTVPRDSRTIAQNVLSTLGTELERLESHHPRSRELLGRAMICITQAVELESQLSVEPASMDGEDRDHFTLHGTSEKSTQVSNSRQHGSSSSNIFNLSTKSRKTVEPDRMDTVTCSQRQSKAVASCDRHGNRTEPFKSASQSLLQKITSRDVTQIGGSCFFTRPIGQSTDRSLRS